MRTFITFVFVLLLASLGVGAWQLNTYLKQPVGGAAHTAFTVKPGMRLKAVLTGLAKEGVIARPLWLYYYARVTKQVQVQVGVYDVSASQTPLEILEMLRDGRIKMDSITFAEGLNRWQVRNRLVEANWLTAEQFEKLCDDTKFLHDNHIPGPTCEGYLFPETYRFPLGIEPERIFESMFTAYKQAYKSVTEEGTGPLELDERKFTTLASIVEKETGAPDERPHIACVFYNRLQAKPAWKLETDPTVIYAATLADPTFDGNITRHHLRQLDNPYNTYRVVGLPPGPIANPGKEALSAVARPATCGDFFFVSMNNGRHVFCPNMTCHGNAVRQWQIEFFRKKSGQASVELNPEPQAPTPPRKLIKPVKRKQPRPEGKVRSP